MLCALAANVQNSNVAWRIGAISERNVLSHLNKISSLTFVSFLLLLQSLSSRPWSTSQNMKTAANTWNYGRTRMLCVCVCAIFRCSVCQTSTAGADFFLCVLLGLFFLPSLIAVSVRVMHDCFACVMYTLWCLWWVTTSNIFCQGPLGSWYSEAVTSKMPKPFTMFYGFVVFIFFSLSIRSLPLHPPCCCPLARSMFHLEAQRSRIIAAAVFVVHIIYYSLCMCVSWVVRFAVECAWTTTVSGKIFIRFRYYYRLCSCTRCEFVFVVPQFAFFFSEAPHRHPTHSFSTLPAEYSFQWMNGSTTHTHSAV